MNSSAIASWKVRRTSRTLSPWPHLDERPLDRRHRLLEDAHEMRSSSM